MTSLTGTLRLVRLGLRRDRVNLAVWVGSLGLLTAVSVMSVQGIYPTEADRVIGATFTAGNRLSRAFDGPASGTELGAMTMVETFGVLAVLAGLMSIFIVTRLTRQDEETGRAELLGSAIVGRRARLTAALVVAFGANLVLGIVTTIVLITQDLPTDGALASGVALGAVGLTFAAVAAVTAQLSDVQRGANGLAATVLGATFLLRAVGDAAGTTVGDTKVVSAWPSWLSPIGWGHQVRPFSDNQWDVFILFAVVIVLLVAAAFIIGDRRDLGAGILPVPPGPATADGRLATPLALLWRLQRWMVAGWAVGLVILASAFASLGDGADELIGLSDEIEAMFTALMGDGELIDAYIGFVMSFIAIIATAFTVQSLLRSRTEETTGRLEAVLSGAVSHRRWILAAMTVSAAASVAILAVVGLAAGVTFGTMTGDLADGIAKFAGATIVQVPAVFALGGFVVAVIGLAPKLAAGVAWAALAASLVMGQLGQLLGLPQAVMNLSPFTHVPAVPAEDFTLLPVAALFVVAAMLGAIGVEAFRRRDIAL